MAELIFIPILFILKSAECSESNCLKAMHSSSMESLSVIPVVVVK